MTLEEVTRENTDKAIRAVLTTHDGKRVLFWLLEQCGIYADPFNADAAATAYVLGQQSIGRRLIAKLNGLDARLYPQLLVDMAEIRELDQAEAEARSAKKGDDDDD